MDWVLNGLEGCVDEITFITSSSRMSVTLQRVVRLRVMAGAAKPGPAIGQALGPLGLNMADFCKQFNEKTKLMEKDIPIPVSLSGMSLTRNITKFFNLYTYSFLLVALGCYSFFQQNFHV